MATHVGRNFCIAPFTQITYSPLHSASPCPYLGGGTWKNTSKKDIKSLWTGPEYESLRSAFKNNEKHPACQRCWNEESTGKQSARKMLLVNSKIKENLMELIDGGYRDSPRQINLRLSNLCNLRCRTCESKSTSLYAIEGKHYEIKNNLKNTVYADYPDTFAFSEDQINSIFEISGNLQRIEFYGGEPLLDKPTLVLLEKLIKSGRSKNITLFYNTNGTNLPKQIHLDLWKHFKALEFNFSLDGIGDHFTYIRHPGKWQDVLNTLEYIRSIDFKVPVMIFAICTVSILNVFYLPEIIEELRNLKLDYFLNMVSNPEYYFIKNIPRPIKDEIINKLNTFSTTDYQINAVINSLLQDDIEKHWDEFKFWTREKDEYRQEQFSNVFPEYFNLIKKYDAQI